MANSAPGVYVNVTASASNSQGVNPTGQWFVVGNAAGPTGVAITVSSMSDFATYFGQFVGGKLTGRYNVTPNSVNLNSTLLYDALDVYFKEGGIVANVSILGAATGATAATATLGTNSFTAISGGTWANSTDASAAGLVINFTNTTVNTVATYAASIVLNGVLLASSPKFEATGAELALNQWINSLPVIKSLCTVSTISGSAALPTTNSTTSIYFASGTDAATADTDAPNALAVFGTSFGPGQVSYPGAYSEAVYAALTDHASANNRVAVLDVNPSHSAAQLISDVHTLQSSGSDTSHAAIFGPWLAVPGATAGFARTVPASSLAAALMAKVDTKYDANVAAAGSANGTSVYATGVAKAYSADDRGLLNSAGINVVRLVPTTGSISVYGYRSLDTTGDWTFLNNVRFRMQLQSEFETSGEAFMFKQIDGRGQLISQFNSALAGVCQGHWIKGSLYGPTPDASFIVNTGTQVNTPATIAAGQLNANVSLKMSPFGEFITINVTKYLANATLPL